MGDERYTPDTPRALKGDVLNANVRRSWVANELDAHADAWDALQAQVDALEREQGWTKRALSETGWMRWMP